MTSCVGASAAASNPVAGARFGLPERSSVPLVSRARVQVFQESLAGLTADRLEQEIEKGLNLGLTVCRRSALLHRRAGFPELSSEAGARLGSRAHWSE